VLSREAKSKKGAPHHNAFYFGKEFLQKWPTTPAPKTKLPLPITINTPAIQNYQSKRYL
jgi:hypothetical protein